MRKSRGLAINGKFLSGAKTGVYRVASEIIRELDRRPEQLSEIFKEKARIIAPRTAELLRKYGTFDIQLKSLLIGQLWENVELPLRLDDDILLSLCNLAPIAYKNAITMIHDAQTFSTPESYSYGFSRFYQTVLPIIGKRHRLILTVSNYSAQQLVKFGIAQADKIRVIYNGVCHMHAVVSDAEILKRLGLQTRKYALALASVESHKNIGVLLRAFSSPDLQDTRLVLFGSSSRSELEAAGYTVPENVIFTGRISDGELRALMESATCFAMPSLTEGFGLPPLEAMLLGCPAVIAPCGALPEVCGDAAIAAAPDAPEEWAKAISALVHNNELWQTWSDRGRRHAAQFTWEKSVDRLLAVIADEVRPNR